MVLCVLFQSYGEAEDGSEREVLQWRPCNNERAAGFHAGRFCDVLSWWCMDAVRRHPPLQARAERYVGLAGSTERFERRQEGI